MQYSRNNSDRVDELIAHSDSGFADDTFTRKSISDYLIFYGNGLISWYSHKQPIAALSTTEAEYIAAAECCKELIYLKDILKTLTNEKVKVVTTITTY